MPTLNSLIHPHNMKVQLNDGSVLNFVSVDNETKKVTAKDDNGNIIILDPTDVKKFEFSLFEFLFGWAKTFLLKLLGVSSQ